MHVLTLIADPAARAVTSARVEAARAVLARLGAAPGAPTWLSPAVACDIPFDPEETEAQPVADAVRTALADAPVDVAVQPAAGRARAVLLADMDSTIVTSETLDDLAEALDLKERVAAITARAMNGELDFAAALRERVGLLAGLEESAVQGVLDRVRLTPGAEALVQRMKAAGATTVLVSGGFTSIAGPVAARCGFDRVVANRLLFEGGRLSGGVATPIVDKDTKLATLHDAAAARGVGPAAVCAVGDGANDLPMLQAAGLGVAFRAKPAVRAAAPCRIDHGDLTALLYLQGFSDTDG